VKILYGSGYVGSKLKVTVLRTGVHFVFLLAKIIHIYVMFLVRSFDHSGKFN
jgi:hypothetical protein